jgi:type II secretory pathway predicted ATPase ExeA
VGQPQLKDLLSAPNLLQFAQRVSSEFHLKALNSSEVGQYIDYRLRAVGARKPLFSRESAEMIAQASCGIPRSINILCDTALVYGFATGADLITADLVGQVIEQKRTFGVLGR